MIHTLIIPDVHGRDFWKEPVKKVLEDTNAHIVFLGDYTDGYPQEWDIKFDYLQHTFDNFKQILDLKKRYPGRVTLLLGNHDCGYAIGSDICDCRTDYNNYSEIEYLFKDNRELFRIAEEATIDEKKFIFSHAGILKGWMNIVRDSRTDQCNPVDFLNNAWLAEDYRVLNLLGDYDRYRGWGGYEYGSPVWSDIRSWVKVTPDETFGFNICGHTQLDEPVMLECIACLDCRRAFYLDEEGLLHDYNTGEEVKRHE